MISNAPSLKLVLFAVLWMLALPVQAAIDQTKIIISTDKPGVAVSPRLYGIFFEDINRSGDGGLYGEMLQNRSFEDFDLPMGWRLLNEGGSKVRMTLDKSSPLNPQNPTCIRLDIEKAAAGRAGILNLGYKGLLIASKDPVSLAAAQASPDDAASKKILTWMQHFADAQNKPDGGLAVEQDKTYLLSFYARANSDFRGPVIVSLEKQDGTPLASQTIDISGDKWTSYKASLKAQASDLNARFVLSTHSSGTLWLDQISLFPAATFNQRPNGLRADLMQMLADLHPAFVRFPAGSFGEGHHLSEAFRWKETVGDLAQRPGQWNIWGYRTTNGLGFYEYLQMCEDLKAEPLFVINCGMAEKDFVDLKDLTPWVQDAIDAIEYANGAETSDWGAQRAAAGHPASFHLRLLEIGNENGMSYPWGGGNARQYADRYLPFYTRVKAEHPEIETIATAPIQKAPINAGVEILDEHYYPTAEWFEDHAHMYDTYDRNGPKIYVGEYATKAGAGHGNLKAALGEAAFMTGMERNSDVVIMSSYAPLFANPAWRAWNPNLIVFDNHRAYGTPSYYAQLLFSRYRPDVILPLDLQVPSPADPKARTPLFAVAGKKNNTGEIIAKVVNISGETITSTLQLDGTDAKLYATATVLSSAKPEDENSFEHPTLITPKETDLGQVASHFEYSFPPYSVTVLSFRTR